MCCGSGLGAGICAAHTRYKRGVRFRKMLLRVINLVGGVDPTVVRVRAVPTWWISLYYTAP